MTEFFDKQTPTLVTFYKVQVTTNKETWTLERRFSQFDTMYHELAKMLADVPALPPKTYFKLTSHEGLVKRRQDLDLFVKALVQRPEILNHSAFRNFLEVQIRHYLLLGSSTSTILTLFLHRRRR